MKIPTSPLLITLALSTSTLAYPTPSDLSPNPEHSPLLAADGEKSWNARPEHMPGRLGRRWGESTNPSILHHLNTDLVG